MHHCKLQITSDDYNTIGIVFQSEKMMISMILGQPFTGQIWLVTDPHRIAGYYRVEVYLLFSVAS